MHCESCKTARLVIIIDFALSLYSTDDYFKILEEHQNLLAMNLTIYKFQRKTQNLFLNFIFRAQTLGHVMSLVARHNTCNKVNTSTNHD